MSGPRALCGEELKIFKTKKGFMSRMRIRFFKSMAGFGFSRRWDSQPCYKVVNRINKDNPSKGAKYLQIQKQTNKKQ